MTTSFNVRITANFETVIDADDEEDAVAQAFEELIDRGEFNADIYQEDEEDNDAL